MCGVYNIMDEEAYELRRQQMIARTAEKQADQVSVNQRDYGFSPNMSAELLELLSDYEDRMVRAIVVREALETMTRERIDLFREMYVGEMRLVTIDESSLLDPGDLDSIFVEQKPAAETPPLTDAARYLPPFMAIFEDDEPVEEQTNRSGVWFGEKLLQKA